MLNRKPIFNEVRRLLGRSFAQDEVSALDAAIDRAQEPLPHLAAPWQPGSAGKALIRKWEGCGRRRADGRFEAYPDPGSADGTPWTIGWGATGHGITQGVIWTQAECDARFDRDIVRYAGEVAKALGDAPTTQNQFDALVSFHYNTGAIGTATLTKLHKAGQYEQARAEFARWINNAGKPMDGLKARRAEEAKLYAAP